MTHLDAGILGLLQGITEYLPVSSSAHLLIYHLATGNDPGVGFDVFLHVGTLLATVGYFWKDWLKILSNPKSLHGVSWITISVATLPALVAGLLLHDLVDTVFRSQSVLMVTLPLGGVLLVVADRYGGNKAEVEQLGIRHWLWLGVCQCFALVPGMSRSGSTIIGGRVLGLGREAAAKASFLMSGPVTLAAIVYELKNWDKLVQLPGIEPSHLVFAMVTSLIFGIAAIHGLLWVVKRFSYLSFAIYRVLLAVALFIFLK